MSLRYKGAVISATPPTTTGGETGVASGSWTLEQQMQAQGAGNWPSPPLPKYIEDVFSTYLYTGNGSTQTITNGIDLSGKGGLVWMKGRSGATDHALYDTARGATFDLVSNGTTGQTTQYTGLTSFGSTGFSIGALAKLNTSAATYTSWTFRKQQKFFDIQTWTGNSTNRTISHALGSVPGCIMVKRTDTTSTWQVYHRSIANTDYLELNTTAGSALGANRWNSTTATSTVFSIGTAANVNASGGTYVAYVFAHNAGGFGLTGTDNVISCGSFTTDGSGNADITLGYEPQWLLVKGSSVADSWYLGDVMRGMSQTDLKTLLANSSGAEANNTSYLFKPTATGFQYRAGNTNATHIYIAIRRGPMKVPTDATKVFVPALQSANNTAQTKVYGIVTDAVISKSRNSSGVYTGEWWDRLRGATLANTINNTDIEKTYSTSLIGFDVQNGVRIGTDTSERIQQTCNWVHYAFTRAPSFFDEVCYTGTGVTRTIPHNLTVVPEMWIVKNRTSADSWMVGGSVLGSATADRIFLQLDYPKYSTANTWTTPTTTTFGIGTAYPSDNAWNASGQNYVAYLFATCAGVSKVGSYTGNGSTQTINCGFTGGARFVLIKRTDSTGDWYVWDTARGMTTLTDPYLLLNNTNTESASLGSVTTVTTGFAVNASILAAINTSGASYIYLAIA